MDTVTPTHATPRSIDTPAISPWRKLTAAALAVTGLAYLLLVTVIAPLVTKEAVAPLVIVVLAIDLLLAGLLLRARHAWLPLLGAVVLLLGMIGAVPHDLPALIHPDNAGHFVFGLIIFGAPVVGIISGVQSSRTDR